MSASTQCPHSDLHFHLNNVCMGDTNVHVLEVSAPCAICEQPMTFLGAVPVGASMANPRLSLDRQQIALPFVADGETPDCRTEITLARAG